MSDLDAVYRSLGPRGSSPVVIGQMGQSLDGFIATRTGASHYVTGQESLVHLHRLRSLVDAVVVGWRTVVADDPRLTVRHVEGPNPVPVIVDLDGRVGADRKVLQSGTRALHVVRENVGAASASLADRLDVPVGTERADPAWLVEALAARGHRRVLVEGGGALVSSFLRAGALDRLHIVVAPLLIGEGTPGVQPAPVDDLVHAVRPPARTVRLGPDVLFDLDLAAR